MNNNMRTAEIMIKRYFLCLNCGKHEFTIEHILQEFETSECFVSPFNTRWGCDECGSQIKIVIHKDGIVETEILEEKSVKYTVLLEIPPQSKSIFLKIKAESYGRDIESDNLRFFYEEHTCPINYFRSCTEIKIGDNDDPHGLAKYINWFTSENEDIGVANELKVHN